MKKDQELEIPDEAIKFIINNYFRRTQVAGIQISVGLSHKDVESIIEFFLRWAKENGHIEDGKLNIKKFKEI